MKKLTDTEYVNLEIQKIRTPSLVAMPPQKVGTRLGILKRKLFYNYR